MLETIAAAGAAASQHENIQNVIAVLSAVASAANAYLVLLVKSEISKTREQLIERIHAEGNAALERFAPKSLEGRVYNLEQRKC